eukprot:COSAG02_NODE_1770_length_10993_cov_48.074995_6_plen_125_part_00
MVAAEEQGQASDDEPELDLATWKLPDSTMKVNFVGKPTSYGSWGVGSKPYGSGTTNEYNEWEDTYRRSIPVSDKQVCLVGVRQVGLSDGFPQSQALNIQAVQTRTGGLRTVVLQREAVRIRRKL